jgi:hypothetical protein
MNSFNNSRSTFQSIIQTIKNSLYAFAAMGVPKGTKSATIQKKALVAKISSAIDSIDTEDFGIRVILVKTKD